MNTIYLVFLFFYFMNNLIYQFSNYNSYGSTEDNSTSMKRICYYAIPSLKSWDKTLKDLRPEDIDPYICTHVVIAFAKIENNTIQPKQNSDIEIYKKVQNLKEMNSELKVMVSVNSGFQEVVKKQESLKMFSKNAAQFLQMYEFDGLDLDWEFPAWPASKKNDHEKVLFTDLVIQLKNSLKLHFDHQFILSLAIAAPLTIVRRSYEIKKLAKNVDFLSLMGYDFRLFTSYFPFTGFNSPLHKSRSDVGYLATLNIEWVANYFVLKGAPKDKLVVGIPTYGRTWKLLLWFWHNLYAISIGPGINGGYMSYPEAIKFLKEGASRVFDNDTKVPYSFKGRNWVTFEDRQSIKEKALWIKNRHFAGVMTWNLNCDDVSGSTSGRKFDLHKVIQEILIN